MNNQTLIKVGMCVSYDWEMLRKSIPRIYNSADVICLGLDIKRHSWAGRPFKFDNDAFYSFVKEIDNDKKIIIYEDDFSLSTLNSRENCNRHRMLVAEKMGLGGWQIQLDTDEYYLDFDGFAQYLKAHSSFLKPGAKAINIACPLVPLIKKVERGYLYVDFPGQLPEMMPMATNKPEYQRARHNGHFNHIAPFYIIHETWARSDDELWYKINNWGHSSEELSAKQSRLSYYNLWKSLDEYNCQYVHNFSPTNGPTWPALKYIECTSIADLITKFPNIKLPISNFQLYIKNNRNAARIRSVINKLKR